MVTPGQGVASSGWRNRDGELFPLQWAPDQTGELGDLSELRRVAENKGGRGTCTITLVRLLQNVARRFDQGAERDGGVQRRRSLAATKATVWGSQRGA